MKRKGQPTEVLECMNCGWKCPWQLYQKTYQRKGLNGGGQGFIEEFVEKFKNTYSYSKRFILIDTLIHCFHWSGAGRPGSASLIEGKMKDVMAFLDHLSYGDKIPEDIEKKREEWRKTWQQNPWSKGKGQ
ncbi:MAG TPA: hypothetical protein ENH69_00340 [Candidatus Aerophobetes bacterium]|uniref:Uncharacterized protein n=1 Tax=Aerophobetes bacterium TaxID=2030807 RepID=A0A7C1MBZ6_UNCAE|nr:hypothetical protein [Candidatus Aerophobetes bacterium]